MPNAVAEVVKYRHLAAKPGSNYRQLFINGRISAEVLYRATVGPEPLRPEDVAAEYGVPLEAVNEAVDYCLRNQELLNEERHRDDLRIGQSHRNQWPYAPKCDHEAVS